ncbi:hypothetical protein NPIL_357231, partial [Nephila pilipes]
MTGSQVKTLEKKHFFFSSSLQAENIMKEAGMEMKKWISNDTTLMSQWAAKGFDTYPVDTSISLGSNKTKVLGLTWQTLDDCLTFIFNCKNPGNKKEGPLTSEEMMEAEYFVLKQEQLMSFHTEMTAMRNGDDICHK